MSSQIVTKKRKSADGNNVAVKKVKTAKSAAQPAPLKSALKKTKTTATTEPTTKKPVVEDAELVSIVSEVTPEPTTIALTPDQTAALLAGFSSDEDDDTSDEAGIDISSLPKPPTQTSQKPQNKQDDAESTPAVLYLNHIPHGFHESQMRAYFAQFGDILNLRLMRNRKTGRSQHHGFIEFASSAVADIVRRTMDKYLLFGRILQVKSVPREQVGEGMWKGGRRGGRSVAPRNRLEGRNLRAGATREVWEGRVEREEKRRKAKMEKLMEMGYVFNTPALKGVDEVPVIKQKTVGDVDMIKGAGEGGEAVVDTTAITQDGPEVVAEVEKTKKRPASGKTEVKKAVKKIKA